MYLLDTNTVIHYLGATLPASAMAFMNKLLDTGCNISVITKMEAVGYPFVSIAEQKTMELFVDGSTIFWIDNAIVNEVIALRKTQRIKLPDAIVAATAIVHGLTLLTHDTGFKKVPGLLAVDPHTL